MEVSATDLDGVKIIKPLRHLDGRGYFSEVFNRDAYAEIGIEETFVQDNFSLSRPTGTVRGLHFQIPPSAQAKIVWAAHGSLFDVVVDIRKDSPSFRRHLTVELNAGDGRQLYIPAGFAHGYCTLEPDTEVFYKVSNYYAPEHCRGILWNDPALAIAWPVSGPDATLSDTDADYPPFAELPDYFPV